MSEIAELREALAFAIKQRNEFWQERDKLLAALRQIAAIRETAPDPWNALNDGPIIARVAIAKVEAK